MAHLWYQQLFLWRQENFRLFDKARNNLIEKQKTKNVRAKVTEMLQKQFLCDIKMYFYSIKINLYSIKYIYMISKYTFIQSK